MKELTLSELEYRIGAELDKFEGIDGIEKLNIYGREWWNNHGWSVRLTKNKGIIDYDTHDTEIKEMVNKIYNILKTTDLAKYLKLASRKNSLDARIFFKIPKEA